MKNQTEPNAAFLKASLNQANGIRLLSHGCRAFQKIPGLKSLYIKGLLLTLLLAAFFFYLQFTFIYEIFVISRVESFVDTINNWWSIFSYFTTPILWIFKIFLWVIMMTIALKMAMICMSFWIDNIIEKVIGHFRDIPTTPFSTAHFIKNLVISIKLSVKDFSRIIFFVILGFIPILGVLFAFFGIACSSGFVIISPYTLILADKDKNLLKDFNIDKATTFKIGWVQALLTYIPLIGWFFMPIVILLQIIGWTHLIESRWQKYQQL